MKIQYFVRTKGAQPEDYAEAQRLRKSGHKVVFANGDYKTGFETTCDAVYLSHDFPHIEKWAESKGIKVLKPEPKEEVKQDADALSERPEEEEKTEEEVKSKPRRTRRKAAEDNDPSE